jgi:hypothetical protein
VRRLIIFGLRYTIYAVCVNYRRMRKLR